MIRLIFLLLMGFKFSQVNAATESENIAIATRYLEAYQAFNIDDMASFYLEDSVFNDPTSEIFGVEHTYKMQGKQAIIERLRSFVANSGFVSLEYQIKHHFEAAGHVTFIGDIKIITGLAERQATACGAIVTVLSIKDGKIKEHRDYFDYRAYMKTQQLGERNCPSYF